MAFSLRASAVPLLISSCPPSVAPKSGTVSEKVWRNPSLTILWVGGETAPLSHVRPRKQAPGRDAEALGQGGGHGSRVAGAAPPTPPGGRVLTCGPRARSGG